MPASSWPLPHFGLMTQLNYSSHAASAYAPKCSRGLLMMFLGSHSISAISWGIYIPRIQLPWLSAFLRGISFSRSRRVIIIILHTISTSCMMRWLNNWCAPSPLSTHMMRWYNASTRDEDISFPWWIEMALWLACDFRAIILILLMYAIY